MSDSAVSFTVSSLPVLVCAVPLGFLLGEYLFSGWLLPASLILMGLGGSVLTLCKVQPWKTHDCLTQYEAFGAVLLAMLGITVVMAKNRRSITEEETKTSKSDPQVNIPNDAKVMQDLLGGVGSLNKQDSRQNTMRSAQLADQVPSYVSFIEWVRANGPDNVPRGFQ